jgi:hypothetical protein
VYRVVVGNTQPGHLNSRTRRAAIVPKHIVPGYNSAGHAPLPPPTKITFGEMRASGVRDVPVYCRDHHCSHHIRISTDLWPDHLRLSEIEDRFVCGVCGKRGADIRPDFRRTAWAPGSCG